MARSLSLTRCRLCGRQARLRRRSGDNSVWTAQPLITRCPVCSYRLRGLPERHACPECGSQYDVQSTVFRHPRRSRVALAVVNGMILVAVVVRGSLRGWSQSGITSAMLFAGMMLGWLWHASRPQRLVVVSSLEIVLIEGRNVQEKVPMSVVSEASWSFVNGDICLTDSKKREVARITRRFLASDSQARKLVREVKRLVGARAAHSV